MTLCVVAGSEVFAMVGKTVGEDAGVDLRSLDEPLPESPWILWLDGLSESEIAWLETAILQSRVKPIGVSGQRWDGFSAIPLASLCRGVISGFGPVGLHAAIETLRRERST